MTDVDQTTPERDPEQGLTHDDEPREDVVDGDMEDDAPTAPVVPDPGPHEAKRNTGFALKWIVIGGLLPLGLGAYFAYDGWIGYPSHNEHLDEVTRQENEAREVMDNERETELREERLALGEHYSETDIFWQKVLGITLPLIGLGMIAWTLYEGRGELRLDADDTLHAPGHPPIPPGAITEIDNRRWDRKGKSFVSYDVAGKTGRVKIDDFVRHRPPTDAIHDRLVWVHEQRAS